MSIEVGGVVEGTVTGITNFGAFVDLADGKVGLVHISEVADVYVNDIKDFLKVGQKVKVKILNVDDKGKIGLSIKRLQPKKTEAMDGGNPQSIPRMPRRPAGNDFRAKPAGRFPAGPVSFEDKLFSLCFHCRYLFLSLNNPCLFAAPRHQEPHIV